MRSINETVEAVHKNAVDKGFWDKPSGIGTLIALVHSELSEALEEVRKGKPENLIYFKDSKPEGMPIELADAVIRIMDICGYYGIDLEDVIRIKHQYNQTRERKHGKRF